MGQNSFARVRFRLAKFIYSMPYLKDEVLQH